MRHEMKNIVIAGAGTMGASMAQTFARYGFLVTLYDIAPEALERARRLIDLNQKTAIEEGVITAADSDGLLSRIAFATEKSVFSVADLIVEAILEDLQIKHDFWREISRIAPEDIVLATNTSGLSITRIAEVVTHPERFVGMHWINPPHIIPLIEVVKGEKTEDACAATVRDLALKVGKKPVVVRDAPGFVLNRIQLAILREALHIQQEGIADPAAIDDVMTYGLGVRYACLGPFRVCDLGGLDIFQNIAAYLFPDLSDAKESFGLLDQRIRAGAFGVKSGQGFYAYTDGADQDIIRYRDEKCTKILKALEGGMTLKPPAGPEGGENK